LVRLPEIVVVNFANPVTGFTTVHSGPYLQIGTFSDPFSELLA
jgi:hypothetical protein